MARKYVKKTQKRKTFKRVKRAARKFVRKSAIIRNPLSQKSLMVPMEYPFSYTLNTDQIANQYLILNGSGYPNVMGQGPTADPVTGDFNYEMPVGLSQYGSMYHKWRVHGSRIVLNLTNLSNFKFRAGLISLPWDNQVNVGGDLNEGPGTATWAAVPAGQAPGIVSSTGAINAYQNAAYVDLMNDPFMKWRTVHESANTRCQTRFVASRLTKNMIGVKDLRDADLLYSDIISTDYNTNPDLPVKNGISTARRGFCWVLKTDSPVPLEVFVQGKIIYYVELFERVIVKNPDFNEDGPAGPI